MNYYKTAQFIPGKGDAWMYYECDADDTVLRQVTHIPSTGEVSKVDDPVVKKLYMKERLQEATEEEFRERWGS